MKNHLNNLFRHFTFIIIVFILMQADVSFAGDYHNQVSRRPSGSQSGGVTLACAQCHMMHGTQGGGDVSNPAFSLIYSTSSTYNIFPKLIKADTVVNLCRFCHDNTGWDPYNLGAPDLFTPSYNASGGDFNAGSGSFDGNCNASPAPPTAATITNGDRRHDIGCNVSTTPPPGFIPYAGQAAYDSPNIKDLGFWQGNVITRYGDGDGILSCEYCHDQHGNTNYRNVRPTPYDPNDRVPPGVGSGTANGLDGTYKAEVTYVNVADDLTSSILQTIIDGDANGSNPAGQFSTSNMKWMRHNAGATVKQIAGFCGKCHINFYGIPGAVNLGGSTSGDQPYPNSTPWRRHPVGGITVGQSQSNGHTDPQFLGASPSITEANMVRVINSDANKNTSNAQPFCFSCHRVHGSTNHTNLIFGPPTSVGGAGSMMRDTCQQCHNQ